MSDYPKFVDEAVETMPREHLERLQEARLMRMIDFAYEKAPLIRKTWDRAGVRPADIRSLKDFHEKVPFIDKDAIRDFRDTHSDACGGLKAIDDDELRVVATTSGTTGDPTPVLIGPGSPNHIGMMRDYWHIGVRPGDYVSKAIFTFRGGHYRSPFSPVGWKSILFSHSPAEVPRIFKASLEYRPTLLMTVSSPLLLAFEQEIDRSGVDPTDIFKSYKGAAFGGEALGERQRKLAESWGLKLFEMGAVGDGITGMECSARAGFHAWEDLVLIECLDPQGDEPVADGELGELVVTMLTDRFNPVIRYRTDDMVRVERAPCSCGRTHSRVFLVGRKSDQIRVGDTVVMPKTVQGIIETHGATRAGLFQFVRPSNDMDHLHLRVGYESDYLDVPLDRFAADIRSAVADQLNVEVKIELTPISELLKLGPPHKIPRMTKA